MTTEVILSRSGPDCQVGGMHIKLPPTRSALSILGCNAAMNGDEFREDGYIYNSGKRCRKWFSFSEDSKYFWEPCLNDVKRIEVLYHRLTQRQTQSWNRLESLGTTIAQRFPSIIRWGTRHAVAYAKPTHSYTGSQQRWWKYFIEMDKGFTYTFDWVDEPQDKSSVELGQQFYHLDRYHFYSICGRKSRLRRWLLQAIEHKLRQQKLNAQDQIISCSINDRVYWVQYETQKYGGRQLDWLPVDSGLTQITL